MALPRVPKIEKEKVDPSRFPSDKVMQLCPPWEKTPSMEWLRCDTSDDDDLDQIEVLDGDTWRPVCSGDVSLCGYRDANRALIAREMNRMEMVDRQGQVVSTVWQGPALRQLMNPHGGTWGGNWMFSACRLPNGRWIAVHPRTDIPGDRDTWPMQLVLMSKDDTPIGSLVCPDRPAVPFGDTWKPTRFTIGNVVVGLEGRVVVGDHKGDLLAAGIHGDHLAWIGKGTVPRNGYLRSDGNDVFSSSDCSDDRMRWTRLSNLNELWEQSKP